MRIPESPNTARPKSYFNRVRARVGMGAAIMAAALPAAFAGIYADGTSSGSGGWSGGSGGNSDPHQVGNSIAVCLDIGCRDGRVVSSGSATLDCNPLTKGNRAIIIDGGRGQHFSWVETITPPGVDPNSDSPRQVWFAGNYINGAADFEVAMGKGSLADHPIGPGEYHLYNGNNKDEIIGHVRGKPDQNVLLDGRLLLATTTGTPDQVRVECTNLGTGSHTDYAPIVRPTINSPQH